MRRHLASAALLVGAAFLWTACGGAASSPAAPAKGSAGRTSVGLTLTIPAAGTPSSDARGKASVSPLTQSVVVTVDAGTPQIFSVAAPACTAVPPITCTFSVSAPYGSDTFVISTYSGPSGTGNLLDQATASYTVVPGPPFSFTVQLGPIVSTLADGGAGSLRAAIAGANAGETITFAPGLSGTIALTGGAIALTKNVTIGGPGATTITVSGSNASRIFTIGTGTSATISGLTLANGESAANGGAIDNLGTVTLTNATLTNNASSDGEGGAVCNEAGGTLAVTSSTFAHNLAQNGGAIGSESANTTVTNSTFTSNTAVGPTGAAEPAGGAIYSENDITIVGSTFTANVAGGNGTDLAVGGAIAEMAFTTSGLTVTNSTFTSNLAGIASAGDGEGDGGAIVDASGDSMTLAGDTFGAAGAGNVASGTGYAYGGAIASESGSSIVVNAGNVFLSNSATSPNAGSQSFGGAIYEDTTPSGNVTITGANTFTGNSAAGGAIAEGGAIGEYSDGALDLHAATGTTFASNSATASDSTGYAIGGAIEYYGSGTDGCCAVARHRGAQNAVRHRGASSAGARRPLAASSYTISGVTFTGNAIGAGANPVANVTGGAVDVNVNTSPITIADSTFSGNTASLNGAVSPARISEGGAISETGATMTLNGDQITNNTAGQTGGGVNVGTFGTLTIANCTITGNRVTSLTQGGEGGGGVYASISTLMVTGTTISGNTVTSLAAGSGGGGVALWTNTATAAAIVNSTISGNSSSVDGGGIESLAPYNLSLTNVTMYQNSASSGSGGNLFNDGGGAIQNSIFAGGSAATGPDIDTPGALASNGYNWIQTAVAGTFAPVGSDHVNAGSPQLAAAGLQSNGGPTQTIADQAASPVTHTIPFAGGVCGTSGPATDQRGYTRGTYTVGPNAYCDIGAFEFSGVP